jgi:hypothetical protein
MPEGSGTLVKLLPQQFVNGFRSARHAVASDDDWPADRAARWAAVESALDRVTEDVLRELADAVGPHLVRITWQREPGAWRETQV